MSAVVRKFTGGYWIVGFSSCRWGGCSEGFRKSNYRICISIQISLSGFGRKTDKEKLSGITAGSPVTKIIWVAVPCNAFCKLLCLLEGKSMGKFGLVGFVLVFWLVFFCWFVGFWVFLSLIPFQNNISKCPPSGLAVWVKHWIYSWPVVEVTTLS